MKKMIKRADGSTSQKGLWDNIRANKGSGKKPTEEMLKQEKKIKKKYQTAGPSPLTPVFNAALNTSKQCIGTGCQEMMDTKGTGYTGNTTGSNYSGPGATGLSTAPQYSSKVARLSDDERAAGEANKQKYKDEAAARVAARKAKTAALTGATPSTPPVVEEPMAPTGDGDFTLNRSRSTFSYRKTGGKSKSSWLEKSKEVQFGNPKRKKSKK